MSFISAVVFLVAVRSTNVFVASSQPAASTHIARPPHKYLRPESAWYGLVGCADDLSGSAQCWLVGLGIVVSTRPEILMTYGVLMLVVRVVVVEIN